MCRVSRVYKTTLHQFRARDLTPCDYDPVVDIPVFFVWNGYIVDGCARYRRLLKQHNTPLLRSTVDVTVVELECNNVAEALSLRIALNKDFSICKNAVNLSAQLRPIVDEVCVNLAHNSNGHVHELKTGDTDVDSLKDGDKKEGPCRKVRFEKHEKIEKYADRYCAGGKKITLPKPLFEFISAMASINGFASATEFVIYLLERYLEEVELSEAKLN